MHDLIGRHLLRVHEVCAVIFIRVHRIGLGKEIWIGIVHGLVMVVVVVVHGGSCRAMCREGRGGIKDGGKEKKKKTGREARRTERQCPSPPGGGSSITSRTDPSSPPSAPVSTFPRTQAPAIASAPTSLQPWQPIVSSSLPTAPAASKQSASKESVQIIVSSSPSVPRTQHSHHTVLIVLHHRREDDPTRAARASRTPPTHPCPGHTQSPHRYPGVPVFRYPKISQPLRLIAVYLTRVTRCHREVAEC